MTTARRIAKNTTVLFLATIISYILGFFTTIYTARYLGAEGFGVISLALSLTGILAVFVDLGINILMVREVARNKLLLNRYFGNIIAIKSVLSILTFFLAFLIVSIVGYPSQVANVIYIITLSVIIGAFSATFIFAFQAFEKMEYQSLFTILNSVLMILGVIIAINLGADVLAFASIYLIVSLTLFVFNSIIYKSKYSSFKFEIDYNFMKKIVKEGLPFGIAGIFITIYYYIDSVMLSIMVNNETVGFYNAAYRLIFVFLAFYTVYSISVFPVMSNFYKKSKESLKLAYERSLKYLLIISLPICVGITILANEIILLIFGVGYTLSILALQILVWTLVFMFLNGISSTMLSSIDKQLTVTKITGIGAIVNIILNIILIPKYSLFGAGFATVFTEFIMLPVFLLILKRIGYLDYIFLIKDIVRIISANIILIVFIIILINLNLNIFILVLTSSIIYVGSLFVTKAFDDQDIAIFKSIISNI